MFWTMMLLDGLAAAGATSMLEMLRRRWAGGRLVIEIRGAAELETLEMASVRVGPQP